MEQNLTSLKCVDCGLFNHTGDFVCMRCGGPLAAPGVADARLKAKKEAQIAKRKRDAPKVVEKPALLSGVDFKGLNALWPVAGAVTAAGGTAAGWLLICYVSTVYITGAPWNKDFISDLFTDPVFLGACVLIEVLFALSGGFVATLRAKPGSLSNAFVAGIIAEVVAIGYFVIAGTRSFWFTIAAVGLLLPAMLAGGFLRLYMKN